MEKTFKKQTERFYVSLVGRMEEDQIYTSKNLQEFILETTKELGQEYKNRPGDIIEGLLQLIGEEKYEKVPDSSVKSRGKGENFIFTLKASPEEIKKGIHEKFETIRGRKRTQKVTRNAEKQIKPLADRYNTHIENMWKIMAMSNEKKDGVSGKEISTLLGLKYIITHEMIEKWISTVQKKLGVKIRNTYQKEGSRIKVRFESLPSTMLSLAEKAADIGLELDTTPIFGKKLVKKVVKRSSATETPAMPLPAVVEKKEIATNKKLRTDYNEEQKEILWRMAGIIKAGKNKAEEIPNLCKVLREKFQTSITGNQLLELVKDNPYFEVINVGEKKINLVALDGDEGRYSFMKIRDSFSPMSNKHTTLVRLGMSFEEVQKFFPESVVIDTISERESIFELHYDESKTSLLKLALFVLMRRGTDKFYDPKIYEIGDIDIKDIWTLIKEADLDFMIENL